jgi:hypothetical protein
MIARIRAAIKEPTIHLFLLILFDIAAKIFLLLLMLSSTPWSWMRRKRKSALRENQMCPEI